MASLPTTDSVRAWFITQRWQEFGAEARANLLRTIAVGLFYLIHLWSYLSSQGWLPSWGILEMAPAGAVGERFHVMVTLLAVAWAMLAFAVWLALENRFFPRWLPYFSCGWDLVLLTTIICLASGPRSPLVVVYFLILALAALRFSLPLVRFSTVGAVVGYLVVLGCARWPQLVGRTEVDLRVPRFHQAIVLLAMILTGVVLGQLVRRAKQVAIEYAGRMGEASHE